MPATDLLIPTVRAAERARPGRASQDRHLILPGAVAVLDGASNPDEPAGRDAGWYADQLATALAARLPGHGHGLADLLADAIAEVADTHGLRPGASPSSTVALLRWSTPDRDAEALALSDSVVVARDTNGAVHVLTDTRIDQLAADLHATYRAGLARGNGYDPDHAALMAAVRDRLRSGRNQPGGHFVAEADPGAAHHARRLSLPAVHLCDAALLTDGASAAVDLYRLVSDGATLLDTLRDYGPDQLLDRIRNAETSDPNGQRWPRSKPANDATVVYVNFRD